MAPSSKAAILFRQVNMYLSDMKKPIWVSLSKGRTELYREIKRLYYGYSDELERQVDEHRVNLVPRDSLLGCRRPHSITLLTTSPAHAWMPCRAFRCSGPFWGRHYIFWHNGKPLTLIYEVCGRMLRFRLSLSLPFLSPYSRPPSFFGQTMQSSPLRPLWRCQPPARCSRCHWSSTLGRAPWSPLHTIHAHPWMRKTNLKSPSRPSPCIKAQIGVFFFPSLLSCGWYLSKRLNKPVLMIQPRGS